MRLRHAGNIYPSLFVVTILLAAQKWIQKYENPLAHLKHHHLTQIVNNLMVSENLVDIVLYQTYNMSRASNW